MMKQCERCGESFIGPKAPAEKNLCSYCQWEMEQVVEVVSKGVVNKDQPIQE